MDHALGLQAQGAHADIGAGLVARVGQLLAALTGQGDQDALALIGLDQRDGLLGIVSAADDNGHAGDIAGDQGHAQLTDEGVGQVTQQGLLIGGRAVDVLQRLQELRAQGGGDAGLEGIVQPVVGGDLFAGHCVVAGQAVSGVGEGHAFALAVLGDGAINGGYGTVVIVVVTAKNSVKKCHSFSS